MESLNKNSVNNPLELGELQRLREEFESEFKNIVQNLFEYLQNQNINTIILEGPPWYLIPKHVLIMNRTEGFF
ncbi:MAG: hypothetical protein KatS3mg085_489 [Candidatus Dojkabacteria bacterium]|nr:MAG: hypothetical protein KatS3mg085_489 [Candidatus Dojkabacteria bacterium]